MHFPPVIFSGSGYKVHPVCKAAPPPVTTFTVLTSAGSLPVSVSDLSPVTVTPSWLHCVTRELWEYPVAAELQLVQ